jgi:hypothetical protein
VLHFIEGPENAIALTIAGTISDDDLKEIMDRLDTVMKQSERIDVFVETRHIDGIQLSALASYTARALPLFGKLKSFRRVAVVADQAWIRVGTRMESLLLPFISYRVFPPVQRDEALNWAFGRDDAPVTESP